MARAGVIVIALAIVAYFNSLSAFAASALPIGPIFQNGPPICPLEPTDASCSATCSSNQDCTDGQICCDNEECGSTVCTDGLCTGINCGPAPLLPSFLCEDGVSFSGPVCKPQPSGLCGYEIQPCPEDVPPPPATGTPPVCPPVPLLGPDISCLLSQCAEDSDCDGNQLCCVVSACGSQQCTDGVCPPGACGPPLGAPIFLCEDGVTFSGFFCDVNDDGFCSYQFNPCPEDSLPPPAPKTCSAEVCCGTPTSDEESAEYCECWSSGQCPFKCPQTQICNGMCPPPIPFDPTFCAVVFILPECLTSDECNGDDICCNSGLCGTGICVDVAGCGPDDCGPPPLAPSVLCEDGVTISGFFCGLGDNGQCGFEFKPCPEDVSPPAVPETPPISDICPAAVCCGVPETTAEQLEYCDCFAENKCPFLCPQSVEAIQQCQPACPPSVEFDPAICPLIFIAPECLNDEGCESDEICCPSGICGAGICVRSDGCRRVDCGPPPSLVLETCSSPTPFPEPLGPLCLDNGGGCSWVTLEEDEVCACPSSVCCENDGLLEANYCSCHDDNQCPDCEVLPGVCDGDVFINCEDAGSQEVCDLLPSCQSKFAFPATPEVCANDFGEPADLVYTGCLPSNILCFQALTWATDAADNGFLFTDSCLPSGFTPAAKDDVCCIVELPGDVNGDCSFNIQDVVAIVAFITGEAIPSACDVEIADLNEDGTVTVQDLVIGIECISGLVDCLVACPDEVETFTCGFNGLECNVDTEACQTFIGGVCGGTFPLPDGTCPPGCSDCGFGGGFPGEDFPSCNCPSYSCVPKVSTSECNNGSFIFGPCICSETADGIQNVTCFAP